MSVVLLSLLPGKKGYVEIKGREKKFFSLGRPLQAGRTFTISNQENAMLFIKMALSRGQIGVSETLMVESLSSPAAP